MSQDLLPGVTGVLALADGTILQGVGCGAVGDAVGEVCFNTAMTGYQEILTDPSYMAQIIAFTFPHVGNVGVNGEDVEQITGVAETAARGALFRDVPTQQANWRADGDFDAWMKARGVIGLAGIDTRALTRKIRETGMPHGVIAHAPDGQFDLEALVAKAKAWAGLEGLDLAKDASTTQTFTWDEGLWSWPEGYAKLDKPKYEVVVIDYGVKRNILRMLAERGCRVTVVPAQTSAAEVLKYQPDGIFLSNGPGDPQPCDYAISAVATLMETGIPTFGICLGHQIMALASGAKTFKMKFGHHGANHPVKNLVDGRVSITSQNHGFAVDEKTLPANLRATHISLFDGTLQGLERTDRPAFCFQGHPEASPGPHDIAYLFDRFTALMGQAQEKKNA